MPPYFTVAPFVLMLLSIAVIPLVRPHWWEHNRHKAIVSFALGATMLVYLLVAAPDGAHHRLIVTLLDYVAFIALLGSLFIISGGIYLRGSLAGTPTVNLLFLVLGSVLASFMGTTGAAMLLIRPIIRANAWRKRQAHIVVFFIFLVANIGGCLTPLGDPPLYLGFLKGVPFTWTMTLWPQWLFCILAVLLAFVFVDVACYRSEIRAGRRPPAAAGEPLRIEGSINFLWLLLIIGVIFGSGMLPHLPAVAHLEHSAPLVAEFLLKFGQAAAMLAVAFLSLRTTARSVREANSFNYHPIVEVAVLFIGIFITMIPALWILDGLGQSGKLGLSHPWQFFWLTGGLSSFLDNAPTYLTFSAAASGLHHTAPERLAELIASTGNFPAEILSPGSEFLRAVSCGAVFMGANTYIGNGPNFMIKSIAEQQGVRMPSFFGYMLYTAAILIPIFLLVTIVFFR
ncbi:MAG: sodium:proton antiporter [Planctomycetes bacterium]|jgi:Na+/H+ antiporter NhaD/arsenite permease-like protein|nr:sodium:proton antiporter [Planctomycetota bacterium]